MEDPKLILVTGATGYIGGRLVPALLDAGYRVRCLVRDARRLQGRPWSDEVEVVEGDALRPETLPQAMEGAWATYYLIHSLTDTKEYRERDKVVARGFGQAAKEAGIQRIIYLGGLGDPEAELSVHLRSRQETGAALSEAGVPVTEFRAAIIVEYGHRDGKCPVVRVRMGRGLVAIALAVAEVPGHIVCVVCAWIGQ